MQHQRVDPNLAGFKAGHCLFCDRTDRPLRQAGSGNPDRQVCTRCGAIWNALPQDVDVNKTYRMVEWRDVVIAAQRHGANGQQIADALVTLGMLN